MNCQHVLFLFFFGGEEGKIQKLIYIKSMVEYVLWEWHLETEQKLVSKRLGFFGGHISRAHMGVSKNRGTPR